MYGPPSGWYADNRMPIRTRSEKRSSSQQYAEMAGTSSSPAVCAAGTRRSGVHGRGSESAGLRRLHPGAFRTTLQLTSSFFPARCPPLKRRSLGPRFRTDSASAITSDSTLTIVHLLFLLWRYILILGRIRMMSLLRAASLSCCSMPMDSFPAA